MTVMMNRYIGTVARMGGVPALLTEFVDSFADMIQWNSQHLCGLGEMIYYPRPPGISLHDVARNRIAESMRGDWLLMLDTDHSFDPSLTRRLINVADQTGVDVVSGLYQYRAPPHSPVLYLDSGDGTPVPLLDWEPSLTALEIHSAGAGCLWVRRRVFDRIRDELKESPFERFGGLGEDHSFFRRLHKLGIKAVAALNVECHHLQVRPVQLSDYDRTVLDLAPAGPARGYK